MSEEQKLVYIFTAAGDRAEDVVTGFTLATVGLSMGHKITIILLGYATVLVKKGYAETVHAPERQPLKKGRKMDTSDLVEGVLPATALSVSEEIAEADKVISF